MDIEMDNDVLLKSTASETDDNIAGSARSNVKMPAAPSLLGTRPPAGPDADKNVVFTSLVRGDTDIAGLVAYSIYKQNKLDWLQAFETAKGRAPDDAEISAYIIGESTARRLTTYRHLAEATLAGNAPALENMGTGPGWEKKLGPVRRMPWTTWIAGGVVAVLAILVLVLAAHLTMR